MKPSKVVGFFAGCVIGASFVGFIWIAETSGKSFLQWGKPQVFFGDEARHHIRSYGIEIPPDATAPYYYVDGFKDHTFFISFTVPPEEAEALIKRRANVGFAAFEPWSNQIPDNTGGIREPGNDGAQFETPYYDVDNLKNAIIYIDKSSKYRGFHFIYDRAVQRLYFCEWDT